MRTLLDLATVVTPHELKRLCHRAEHVQLLDGRLVPPGRRGASRLRTAMATLERAEPQITRNDLEEAMLAIVDRYGLPQPRVNFPLLDYVIDFYWPEHRLAVEADGRGTHLTPSAFEDDRRRDALL